MARTKQTCRKRPRRNNQPVEKAPPKKMMEARTKKKGRLNPKTGKMTNPYKYKPGTQALRALSARIEWEDTKLDKKDLEFKMDKLQIADVPISDRVTRGSLRTFYNVASNARVLPKEHGVWEEGPQFFDVYNGVNANTEQCKSRQLRSCKAFETPNGIWYTNTLRYNRPQHKKAAVDLDEKSAHFLQKHNACLGTVVADFNTLLPSGKPVTIVVGQKIEQALQEELKKQANNEKKKSDGAKKTDEDKVFVGHAVCLTVMKKEGQRVAVVKDSASIEGTKVSQLVIDLSRQLNVKSITLVGMLDKEVFGGHYTDCLKEAYKEVGDVLDGNGVWTKSIPEEKRFTRTANSKDRIPPPFKF